MKCKFCQAELEQNSSVCPECGKDNLKDNMKSLKIVALTLTCVVMLVLLVGIVNYGVTGSFLPNWGGNTDATVSPEQFAALMDTVVATMGEHKLTNRELQLYYWMAAFANEDKVDLTKDLNTQIYDETTGKTYHTYFLEEALELWQEITLMADQAVDNGFKMPSDYNAQFETMKSDMDTTAYYYYGLAGADELVAQEFGAGCNFDTYYGYVWDYYLGALYWQEKVDALEVTDQEIQDFFAKNEKTFAEDYDVAITKDFGNMVDYRNILVLVTGTEMKDEAGNKTTVITDADWAKCLEKAEKILSQWESGEKTAESFGALATAQSQDTKSKGNGGLRTDQYGGLVLSEVDVRHILLMPQGATSTTIRTEKFSDEAWAWAEAEAKRILDLWLAGDKTEESFGALANEHSMDADGKVTNGGIYEDVTKGVMVKSFEDWCFDPARQVGDYGIVKTEFGYHIMYFVHSDKEASDWTFAEERKAGDVAILKTDKGYQIIFIEAAEPAWYRCSRYGAQGEKGDQLIDAMIEANPYTVDYDKIYLNKPAATTAVVK
jgi:parvulin-like peptidyl-prolyl isomerase